MGEETILKPVINKKNGQINFSLKKNSLPKSIKKNIKNLKGIKLNFNDLKF